MYWIPSTDSVAQWAHVLLSAVFVLGSQVWTGSVWKGCLLGIVFAVLKELFWDVTMEEETFASSLIDLFWYMVGLAITVLMVCLIPGKSQRKAGKS